MIITITLTQILITLAAIISLSGWLVSYQLRRLLKRTVEESKDAIEKLVGAQTIDKERLVRTTQEKFDSTVKSHLKELGDIQSEHEQELTEISNLAETKFKELESGLGAAVDSYEKYITNIDALIQISNQKIKEIDEKGIFKTDDELQFFFEVLKDIQSELDKFRIDQSVSENQ